MTRRKEYRRYSAEFKSKAVKLSLQDGVLSKDVAESLDIHPLMLSRWRKLYREGKLPECKDRSLELEGVRVSELRRLRKLEQEHARLKEEHSLLKKAIQFSLEQKQRSSNS
jgi:transposase